MKICLISSSGGHLSQLKELLKIMSEKEYFIVTEENDVNKQLIHSHKVYFLHQQERKSLRFFYTFSTNIFRSLRIVIKEKPDVIITTGAGAVIPLSILGKLFGAKLIFIESFAKIKTPTLTGRILYNFADKFYIQWEDLRKYYPKAEYRGTIY
jgi:beta-1,4-N-acetylglucosaminyltransferase